MNQINVFKPYFKQNKNITLDKNTKLSALNRSWFTSTEIASIYQFPTPSTTVNKVIGVISFGGGVFGNISANGILTGGDFQTYWSSLGISSANMPTVVVVLVDGATNRPVATDGATIENTIDIQTIGGCYPSSKLTIIIYIAPNTFSEFVNVINYALNTPVTVNGLNVTPSVLSISWGAPEIYYGSIANSIDAVLATAVSRGINVCVASGDNGSSDGVNDGLSHPDFPAASPNVIACGGTSLVCPNNIYDNSTVETVWSGSGGALSSIFSSPSYQSSLNKVGRSVPDIALNADPNTGVLYLVGGNQYIVGGTSIAAPAMAAFIALTNINYFANTRLYTYGYSCYHDISVGNNGAFSALTGYDNCTGIGSIIGNTLSNALLGNITNVPVTGITVNTSSVTLSVTQTTQIIATIAPSTATNQNITWSSNNTNIATVVNGLITAISVGTTIISVTTSDGSFVATVAVTVQLGVASVSVSPSSVALRVNQNVNITATVLPANAPNKTVTWSSSNTNVVRVNNTGMITGVGNGNAVVTVRTQDGNKTATTNVVVTTAVTGVSVNVANVSLTPRTTRQIIATVLPTTASNKTVTWSSSNSSIATVGNHGLITAIKIGSATITARTQDGNKTATVTTRVVSRLSNIYNNNKLLHTLINKY